MHSLLTQAHVHTHRHILATGKMEREMGKRHAGGSKELHRAEMAREIGCRVSGKRDGDRECVCPYMAGNGMKDRRWQCCTKLI